MCTTVGETIKVQELTTIVITTNPGTNRTKAKGWRPIVLANTVGKMREEIIAQVAQTIPELWDHEAFAGRKGRGPIDSVMLLHRLSKEGCKGGKGRAADVLEGHPFIFELDQLRYISSENTRTSVSGSRGS